MHHMLEYYNQWFTNLIQWHLKNGYESDGDVTLGVGNESISYLPSKEENVFLVFEFTNDEKYTVTYIVDRAFNITLKSIKLPDGTYHTDFETKPNFTLEYNIKICYFVGISLSQPMW